VDSDCERRLSKRGFLDDLCFNYVPLYRGADKSLAQPTSLSIFFQFREQVEVQRGQIRRIGWVIKTLEAQVSQFLLGCKCPVSRFLPGRAKDLSALLYF
jgi:hypothetical protein